MCNPPGPVFSYGIRALADLYSYMTKPQRDDSLWSGMPQPYGDDDLWCRRYRPASNPTTRLVCLPHAGGSAPFFRPVAVALGAGIDVVAIQYLAARIAAPSSPLATWTCSPTASAASFAASRTALTLFGQAMGAILGFEVTRRLEADGTARLQPWFGLRARAPSCVRDENVHRP